MDRIAKFLKRLNPKEREDIENITKLILKRSLLGLDVKKLKGEKNLFRARRGNIRIVFIKVEDSVRILLIERRSDNTYK